MGTDGGLRGKRVAFVACGSWHSLAATDAGELYAWGVALMSRCGFDTTGMPLDDQCPYQPTPCPVVAMPKVKLGDVANTLLRGPESVCADLKDLLQDESYADVCFEVGGEELRAHVAILVARCDHFRCMFRSGMAECRIRTGDVGSGATDGMLCTPIRRVQVTDCSPVAFRQLPLWLYSGTVDSEIPMEELASLLRLADVYAIPALRSECERLLALHIDVDSVLALLQVAIEARAADLTSTCLNFAVANVHVWRHPSFSECNDSEVLRRLGSAWACELEGTCEQMYTTKGSI